MKLQRVVNRVRGENTYHRWQVALPQQEIETLGWQPGDELEAKVIAGALVLKRLPKKREPKA